MVALLEKSSCCPVCRPVSPCIVCNAVQLLAAGSAAAVFVIRAPRPAACRFCRDGTAVPVFAGAQAFPSKPVKLVVPTRRRLPDTVAACWRRRVDREVEPAGHHRQPAWRQRRRRGTDDQVRRQRRLHAVGHRWLDVHHQSGALQQARIRPPRRISYRSRRSARRRCSSPSTRGVPANTLAEFIASRQGQPRQGELRHPGIGSTHHLTGESFSAALGINMVHAHQGHGAGHAGAGGRPGR